MAYGDNAKIVGENPDRVMLQVDGFQKNQRVVVRERRFLCKGGPLGGQRKSHSELRYLDRVVGYHRYNKASAGFDSPRETQVWVWFGEK